MAEITLVVQGAAGADDIVDFERIAALATVRFAPDAETLTAALPGADALLGWKFSNRALPQAWHAVDRLRWIHWCGAGVDAALFPELAESEVLLTNTGGVFDRAMAEYALGLMIAMAKDFPETLHAQRQHRWSYRGTELMRDGRVLVVGAGSIGRELARLLTVFGLQVEGVSRTPRARDPDFGQVHGLEQLHQRLALADWVIAAVPLTPLTRDMLGAPEFAAMKPSARFINLGRGPQVDEQALSAALSEGRLAGAALDVFREEPLPETSPLWDTPGLIVSPHMSGDFHGYQRVVVDLFVDNLQRFRAGQDLRNLVDKKAGFVARSALR